MKHTYAITLLSDYGLNTYYTAVLKEKIWLAMPEVKIIDISHQLPSFDVMQAAFLLKSTLLDFTTPTIHLVAVDTNIMVHKKVVFARKDKQWVISADNGLFSLLFQTWDEMYLVNSDLLNPNDTWPEKNLFVTLASKIINEVDIGGYAQPTNTVKELKELMPAQHGNQLTIPVIHVDGYENIMLNMNKTDFEKLIGDKAFELYYRKREAITQITLNYHEAREGDGFAVFNSSGWLEIGINKGKGQRLLGLKPGDYVILQWYD